MSEEVSGTLKEIARKLDILIALARLANKEQIQGYHNELAKDPVYSKILEVTSEPISYSNLSRSVAEATGAAEITVKKKLAELKEVGALATKREGREVFYENTGFLG